MDNPKSRRKSTKIPRAPAKQPTEAEMEESRKRKPLSPVKANQQAKRPALTGASRPGRTVAKMTETRAASSAPPPLAPEVPEQPWEEIAAAKGWAPEDCLNHKLALKKREKEAAMKETFMTHIRCLRSLGRHLLSQNDSMAAELQAAQARVQAGEAAAASDRTAAAAASADLQRRLDSEQASVVELAASSDRQAKSAADQSARITQIQEALSAQEQTLAGTRKDLALSRQEAADLKTQVTTWKEMHDQAQKYNAQLQQYNSKLQDDLQAASTSLRDAQAERNSNLEEAARLKGTVAALEAQVQAASQAVQAGEEARQAACGQAGSLQAGLDREAAARTAAEATCAQLREELERFKDCTGKSVEMLEREKADKQHLQSQNSAQAQLNSSLQAEVGRLQADLQAAHGLMAGQAESAAREGSKTQELAAALQTAEQRVRECELVRRKLHNTIQELKGNIRVFARVRPAAEDQAQTSMGGLPVVAFPAEGDQLGRALELQVQPSGGGQPSKHPFSFDRVFGPASTQEQVFEEVSQLVQSALDGYKVCIFAYGQTGSGKTHTMMGPQFNQELRGVIPRAVEQLYEETCALEASGWTFDMKASMLEIYNEDCKDLLGKGTANLTGPSGSKRPPVAHDGPGGQTTVAGVDVFDVRCEERLKALMAKAAGKRSVGATAANEHSSRSHMVFMLTITGTHAANGHSVHGVLNLIDLAGSERLSKSLAVGERLKETQAINKSLSALGDVIAALGAKEAHVPYRNSRLTYLLQPCLGGDAKTLMFVNLAPTADAAQESLCSLRFAAKVNATDIGTAKRMAAPTPNRG